MFFKYNIPGILWASFILLLMGLPGKDLPDEPFINFDKLAHVAVFTILIVLLIFGFKKQYAFKIFRSRALIIALILGVFYGGITEVLQGMVFVDRVADIYDFIANAIGSVLGVLSFYLIYNNRKHFVNIKKLLLI